MEYTQQQKEGFKTEFAARRKRQILATLPMILVFLVVLIADSESGTAFGIPLTMLLPFGLLIVAGVVIFALKNWRCPACDRYLGKNKNPHFCPKCGVALR